MPSTLLRGVRVLIVEDERLLAAELADRLAGAGAVIVGSVDTGDAAIRWADTHRPDIVLMDVRLKGGLDGIETAGRLQATASPAAVVFLSAHTDDATLARARAAGAYGFLGKPLRDRDVFTTMSTALERHRLEQRTRELNTLLIERTQQLEAKNRELDEFASVVSHDLQAPLRNVRMLLDLLGSEEPLGPDNDDIAARARRNAQRMSALVDSLLGLARAGSLAMTRRSIDAAALCHDVVADLRAAIDDAHATVSLPDPGCVLHGDPTLLRQLLQNLVANAIKFRRPEVAPVVTIEAHPTADGAVEIQVRDNGIGFDPQLADRLFERFSRLATARAYDGSGIGLATCARIVERHQGTIRAHGEPGIGAVFGVVLPGPAPAPAAADPALAGTIS